MYFRWKNREARHLVLILSAVIQRLKQGQRKGLSYFKTMDPAGFIRDVVIGQVEMNPALQAPPIPREFQF
jgi:hypothetical protein